MPTLALLALVATTVAFLGALAVRREGEKNMTGPMPTDKATRVKAIYDRAKARIAELRKRRRETAERFVRAAERARAESIRKNLDE